MPPVIRAEHLRKKFGSIQAVDDVSFAVEAGECFGLLGPNGAGKTTSIRMLYGYTPRDGGRLELFGLDLDRHLRQVKARIGICQQEDSLDPDLSVRENLVGFARYFSIPRRIASQRVGELLDFFALETRADANIRDLSGGLKRRLMLARALVNDPDLLILDEPTVGLDPQSRQLLWDKLAELKSRGLTILLTTHYMEEAERLCDRLVIVDHGHVLVTGAPAKLVAGEVGHAVIEVVEPDEDLRAFLGNCGRRIEDLGRRLLVYIEEGDDLFVELSTRARLATCTLRAASLEDLFLKLTGRELRE